MRFNTEGFPGEWHLVIVQVVGEGLHAASWTEFTYADGSTQPGLCFFELKTTARSFGSQTSGPILMNCPLNERT